jgi:hypothetical protein
MPSQAHQINQLANKYVPWTTLREIGNLSAVKLTILLPAIGYLIIFNENVIEYLKLSPELGLDSQSSTISIRLLTIYFGLTFVASDHSCILYFVLAQFGFTVLLLFSLVRSATTSEIWQSMKFGPI